MLYRNKMWFRFLNEASVVNSDELKDIVRSAIVTEIVI